MRAAPNHELNGRRSQRHPRETAARYKSATKSRCSITPAFVLTEMSSSGAASSGPQSSGGAAGDGVAHDSVRLSGVKHIGAVVERVLRDARGASAFMSSGTVAVTLPGLSVEGLGDLSLPLTQAQVSRLFIATSGPPWVCS
jgi:hypothetical protein